MKTLKLTFISFFILALAGCAPTLRFTSDYDDAVDFSAYETFDWMSPPRNYDDPLGDYPTIALRIKRAVEDELIAKGFKKVDEDPDFFVVYHASVERRLTRTYIDTWGYYYPHYRYYPRYRRYPRFRSYPPVVWGLTYVDGYDEGTLVIDIVDATTNELVWRGSAIGAVGDPVRAREKVGETVRMILEEFPPPSVYEEEGGRRISEAR